MIIRVLIKRKYPVDKFKVLKDLINQLRSTTAGQPGYISGETLLRLDQDGECLVISKWKSRTDWDRWYAQPERDIIQKKIDNLVGSRTVYEIYGYE
jgi:heme-degrading monooxygenase HmoA